MGEEFAELRDRVAEITWYHRIVLPGGVVTPGLVDGSQYLRRLRFPETFAGRDVLDVGCWDGFYAFEAKRRDARRVVASDSYCWHGDGWGTKHGFLLAREALKLDVADVDIDVLELSAEKVGVFDDVLFLGVLYHLRDPLTALERIAAVTGERLILETETSLTWLRRPATELYAGGRLNQDGTNYYAPNPSALQAMLRMVGFARTEVVSRTPAVRRVQRAVRRRITKHIPVRESFRSQRIVIHAWK